MGGKAAPWEYPWQEEGGWHGAWRGAGRGLERSQRKELADHRAAGPRGRKQRLAAAVCRHRSAPHGTPCAFGLGAPRADQSVKPTQIGRKSQLKSPLTLPQSSRTPRALRPALCGVPLHILRPPTPVPCHRGYLLEGLCGTCPRPSYSLNHLSTQKGKDPARAAPSYCGDPPERGGDGDMEVIC